MGRERNLLAPFIKAAEEQGWRVEPTRNGHYKFFPKDQSVPPVTCNGTPGSQRARENVKADLRRAGLILPDNAGREPTAQERRLAEKTEDLREAVFVAIEPLAPTPSDLAVIAKADANLLTAMSLLINPDTGRIDLTCACRSTFHRLGGFMKHIGVCDQGADNLYERYTELEKETNVKRDMRQPPARERLNCTECSDWFWVSQPHLLEQHMAGEHGMKQCPYCESWERMENGQITKHVNKCEKRPEGTPPASPATVIPPASKPRPRRPRPEPAPARETFPVMVVPTIPTPAPKDTPTPFTWRRVGQRVTATTYHLYKDCGMVQASGEFDHSLEADGSIICAVEHVNLDDTMIGLLGLRCCRACDRRSKQLTVEQMLTEWFTTMDRNEDDGETLAIQFLIDLAEHGFTIKKGK